MVPRGRGLGDELFNGYVIQFARGQALWGSVTQRREWTSTVELRT